MVMILVIFSLILGLCLSQQQQQQQQQQFIPASDDRFYFNGRFDLQGDVAASDWSGSSIVFSINGSTSLTLEFEQASDNGWDVMESQGFTWRFLSTQPTMLVSNQLDPQTTYTFTLFKRTEPMVGITYFSGISITGRMLPRPIPNYQRRIEFIGDSITCGFGLLGTPPCNFNATQEDNYLAWGNRIAGYFDAEYRVEAWSGKGVVKNYGSLNYTSPDPLPFYYPRTVASNSSSPIWSFDWVPDAVVINLGTNDYSLEPVPPQDVFINAYVSFVKELLNVFYRFQQPTIILACGPLIEEPCCSYVQQVASKLSIPYLDLMNLLETGDYGCDGHPNVIGHEKMANASIPLISQVMNW